MTTMASQITSLTVVYSIVYSGADKKNIKAPRHWPLCGELTGTGEFPAQKASNAENVSIWWRHHVLDYFEHSSSMLPIRASVCFVVRPRACVCVCVLVAFGRIKIVIKDCLLEYWYRRTNWEFIQSVETPKDYNWPQSGGFFDNEQI